VTQVMEERSGEAPFAYTLYRDAYDQRRDRVEANTPVVLPPMAVSGTVKLQMTAATESFEGTATSTRGSGKTFSYDSITDTFLSN